VCVAYFSVLNSECSDVHVSFYHPKKVICLSLLPLIFSCLCSSFILLSLSLSLSHTHIGFRVVTNEVRTADKGWEEGLKTSPCYKTWHRASDFDRLFGTHWTKEIGHDIRNSLRFKVLKAVNMPIEVFWVVIMFSLVGGYKRFDGVCFLRLHQPFEAEARLNNVFKNSACTSKRTPHFTITAINCLRK
jgi:hypothetical protein